MFFFDIVGAYFDIVCGIYLSWWSRLYWRVPLRFYSVFDLFIFLSLVRYACKLWFDSWTCCRCCCMWSLHFGLLYELCFALIVLLIFFLPNRLFLGYVNVSTLELCSLPIWIFVILGLRLFQVLSMVVILFFAFFFLSLWAIMRFEFVIVNTYSYNDKNKMCKKNMLNFYFLASSTHI
jgi:hypothetical protein